MSDKNNPQRLEKIAHETEDEVAKEALLHAAKEIKRCRTRLKDGHQERGDLKATIVGLNLDKKAQKAQIDRLMDLSLLGS